MVCSWYSHIPKLGHSIPLVIFFRHLLPADTSESITYSHLSDILTTFSIPIQLVSSTSSCLCTLSIWTVHLSSFVLPFMLKILTLLIHFYSSKSLESPFQFMESQWILQWPLDDWIHRAFPVLILSAAYGLYIILPASSGKYLSSCDLQHYAFSVVSSFLSNCSPYFFYPLSSALLLTQLLNSDSFLWSQSKFCHQYGAVVGRGNSRPCWHGCELLNLGSTIS